MSAAKIAQHTGALKAFSNLYVYKVMEYTRSDLLQRVDPYRPKPDQHRDFEQEEGEIPLVLNRGSGIV
jgi:hypothetical protein